MNRNRSRISATFGLRLAFAPRTALAATALVSAAPVAAAAAESDSLAKQLFLEAVAQMKAGENKQACEKLEESYRIEARMGVRYVLAECYARTKKPASAWRLFTSVTGEAASAADREAAIAAATTDTGKRAKQEKIRDGYLRLSARAQDSAARIEPGLPRLSITLPAEAKGIRGIDVRLDGEAVSPDRWGTPIPVDFGEHTVRASAPGRKPSRTTTTVDTDGVTTEVLVPPLSVEASGATAPPITPARPAADAQILAAAKPPVEQDAPSDHTGTLALMTAGIIFGTAGTVAGFKAISSNEKAKARCPDGCSATDFYEADKDASDARTTAGFSTISFTIAGLTLGGAALREAILAANRDKPRSAVQLVPLVGPEGASLTALVDF